MRQLVVRMISHDLLTDIGLEVEGIQQIESVKGGLKGVVVGKVLTKEKHPNADRLNVTTVDLGIGDPVQIVCGAPNVNIGQLVPVATVGTWLYDGDEKFKIKSDAQKLIVFFTGSPLNLRSSRNDSDGNYITYSLVL